jgi:hypothetical protein
MQEELHQTLLPYGINTKAVDRYVVTQQRQALAVADPVALVQHFELLLVGVCRQWPCNIFHCCWWVYVGKDHFSGLNYELLLVGVCRQ